MRHLEFVIEVTKKFIKDMSELRPEDESKISRRVRKQYPTVVHPPEYPRRRRPPRQRR